MKKILILALLFSSPVYAGCSQYNPHDCEVIPPPYQSAPEPRRRGFDEPYGYTDNFGWHTYPHGEPKPGGLTRIALDEAAVYIEANIANGVIGANCVGMIFHKSAAAEAIQMLMDAHRFDSDLFERVFSKHLAAMKALVKEGGLPYACAQLRDVTAREPNPFLTFAQGGGYE
ncbi:MAG: hypothetical protein C5B60_10225 [Chloroflexi bacterium]|nr:MAG: hypothetical protein C5B60_10225 [Chloroflexota bacterium]